MGSGKSRGVFVELMLVVAVLAGSVAEAQIASFEIVNELKDDSVEIFGTKPTATSVPVVVIPPGESRTLPVQVVAPLTVTGSYLRVDSNVYFVSGSVLTRILVETGTVRSYITGLCAFAQPGVQIVTTTAMDTPTRLVCAAPAP